MNQIVIADDEPVLASMLEEQLSKSGYHVSGKAGTARECIALCTTNKPDLVLMDIVMPGELDGIDAVQIIQQMQIPVILISSYSHSTVLSRAEQSQPAAYLVKPFTNSQLLTTVAITLAQNSSNLNCPKPQAATLQEINHRITNQLSALEMLIEMQVHNIGNTGTVPAMEVHSILQKTAGKIRSISKLHAQLQLSRQEAEISMTHYIHDLLQKISSVHCQTVPVSFQVEVEPHSIDYRTAAQCGLIINELVWNALCHAFQAPNPENLISVAFQKPHKNTYRLSVCDNGTGFSDPGTKTGSGLALVDLFVKQLQGTFDLTNDGGTHCSISFPAGSIKNRPQSGAVPEIIQNAEIMPEK